MKQIVFRRRHYATSVPILPTQFDGPRTDVVGRSRFLYLVAASDRSNTENELENLSLLAHTITSRREKLPKIR